MLVFSSLGFQQGFDPVAKQKVVYIYGITKYFDWPEKMKTGNFIIQIVGNNSNLSNELTKMSSTKQVGNQKIEVKISSTIDQSSPPHIIFLLNESSDLLKDATTKYKGKGTLIITEKPGMAKSGSVINFVAVDNKQKFEYSKSNAIKAGLKTSDELKSIAIAID